MCQLFAKRAQGEYTVRGKFCAFLFIQAVRRLPVIVWGQGEYAAMKTNTKAKAIDMTSGKPARTLLLFALPMILGNLFQQLYNIVDTMVVGNYVGYQAVAAVGAATPVVFLMIAVAVGLTNGCSILVSQYFGAKSYENMRKAAYASLVVILICAIGVTVLFLFISRPVLVAMGTPDNILDDAFAYLQIFNVGLVFLFFYNTLSSIMRAVGDSKTPLYFLIITTILNIVLDLVFVVNMNLGVVGVAWGTFVSQAVSAILILIYFLKRFPLLKFNKEDRVVERTMVRNLMNYGIPSTIQQFIISFSAIMIQGLVNSFGDEIVAGYTAATKIDNMAIMPLMNLTMALSTFVAQNIGAGKMERVKQGYHATLWVSLAISMALATVCRYFGSDFIHAFVGAEDNPVVLGYGSDYISVVSFFYFVMACMFSVGSVLRGAGDVFVFMMSSVLNLGVRVGAAYLLAPLIGAECIQYSIPIGWASGLVWNLARYLSGKWKGKAAVDKAAPRKEAAAH